MKVEKKLNELATLRMFSKLTLYSPEAKSSDPNSCMQQAKIDIRKFLDLGLIAKIPQSVELSKTESARRTFYFVTRDGYKAIDRLDEFKPYQALSNNRDSAQHRSSVLDIARAFMLNYPDYRFYFEYQKTIEGRKPDIFIKMYNQSNEYHFWVEVERKRDPSRTFRDKVEGISKVMNKIKKEKLYKKYGMSYRTKVLIVYNDLFLDPFIRPNQYGNYQDIIKGVEKQFFNLLKLSIGSPNYFLFLPFYKFPDLGYCEWHKPPERTEQGLIAYNKIKLIPYELLFSSLTWRNYRFFMGNKNRVNGNKKKNSA